MRNIDDVKVDLKNFSIGRDIAMRDLPSILRPYEKIIGITRSQYDKLKSDGLFAFTNNRIIFTDSKKNLFKEWSYNNIIKFEGKKGFLFSDFIFTFEDETLKVVIYQFKKIYPEIIKYISPEKIYDKKSEPRLSKKEQKYNKLIEQIPESIRAEIITYPMDKWRPCIKELEVLPDILLADETMIDFSYVDKTEHRKNEDGDTGMIVVTNKRVIYLNIEKYFRSEIMAFYFDQLKAVTCTDYSLIIQVANSKIEYRYIDTPLNFMNLINERMRLAQNISTSDFTNELLKLANLKKEGLLTDEEFNFAKKKLLR